jgi:hypothetical protein
MLSHSYARAALSYDCKSGAITWLSRPRCHFATEKAWIRHTSLFSGRPAGTLVRGRLTVQIDRQKYHYGRLAWFLFHGVWPDGVVDHIDGDPSNNRLENLRDVSQTVNMRNQKMRCTNTSGETGVYRQGNGWVARISRAYLGYHKTKEGAVSAVRRARSDQGNFTARHGQ